MYPLKAILIGVEDDLLPPVRRELDNCSVRVEAEFAASDRAMDALRKVRGERRLLVYRLVSSPDLEPLSRLSASLPGWPVLALLGGGGEPTDSVAGDLIGFMRAGVSQFVFLPPRTADLTEALARIAAQFIDGDGRSGHGHARSSLIAVGGVNGGCGATTIAINLADAIVHGHGVRCILVDLSLRIGKVAAHLDVVAPCSIIDLLRDIRRVDTLLAEKALVQVSPGFKILAGPAEIIGPTSVPMNDVAELLATLSQLADIVLLDVPCTYDDLYFEALASADHTVLVGEQTIPSIRALKLVHESLEGMRKHAAGDKIVINRYDPKNTAFAVDRLLEPIGVSELSTIACDHASASAALHKGCPIRLATPRSPALADIVALAGTLVSPGAPLRASSPGLFSRIRRVFANT